MSDVKVTIGGDARDFAKAVEGVKGKLSSLGSGMRNIATLGGLAGGGMVLSNAIKQIGELSDAAANVGMSVEEYQKLRYAFVDVGLSAEEADKAVSTMNAKIGAAAQGDKAAAQALAKLGVTYEGIADKSPAEQFESIAKAIAKLPSLSERAAASTAFFGKSGKKLDQLVTGYDAVMAKISGNAVVSADAADAADRLGDEMAKLNAAFNVLVSNSGLIEFLTGVASTMDGVTKSIKEGVDAIGAISAKAQEAGATGPGAKGGWRGFIDDLTSSSFAQNNPYTAVQSRAWRWLRGVDKEKQLDIAAPSQNEIRAFRQQQGNLGQAQDQAIREKAEKEARMAEEAKKKLEDKSDKKKSRGDKDITDSLLRIGGRIGGVASVSTPQDKTNDLLQQILVATNTQTARMPRPDPRSPAARGEG